MKASELKKAVSLKEEIESLDRFLSAYDQGMPMKITLGQKFEIELVSGHYSKLMGLVRQEVVGKRAMLQDELVNLGVEIL